MLLFAVMLVARHAAVQYESGRRLVRERARLLAEDIDREVDRTWAAAEVLSLSRTLQSGQLAAFYEQAAQVRDRLGTNVVLRDPSAQQLVNTRVPWGTSLPRNSADVDSRVIATRRPQVSGVFIGGILRSPLLIIVAPVLRGDDVIYLLSLTIPPERLSAIISSDRLPLGWGATLIDGSGTVIARSQQTGPTVGTRELPEALKHLHDGSTGVFRIESPDGVTRLQTYSRTGRAGWIVGVTVPEALVTASARQDLFLLAIGGTGLLVVGLGIATALGRRLTLPMFNLAEAARLLGAGKQPRSPKSGIAELDVVSQAYESAADLIEKRTAALRSSEQRYARLANATREGVAIHDCGIIVETNASFARMFGYALDEVIGKPLDGLVAELPDRALPRPAAGSDHAREALGVRKDKTTFPLEISGSDIEYDGQPMRVELIRDLTAQKAAEASLRDSQLRLETLQSELLHVSRVTDMGQMTAALAHEINQPLASAANLLGGCRLLLESSRTNTEQMQELRERLALASDQMVRVGEIIRRLRNFIARGETERRLESARQVLKEACALTLVGVAQRGIAVQTDLDTSAHILVDRVQVQQVLVNLVRNAVEAMRDSPRKKLAIRVSERNDMIEICVSDTGEGIPAEVAGRIFEPFTSSKAHGMGIGLSVCRKIVEAHGGKIVANPRPGGGTTFCFTIPTVRVSPDAG